MQIWFFYFQIWFKPHLKVVWNVIPIRFLQMHLSLDALAAQIGFQIVFRVTLNMTRNDNIKPGDRNARSIHTVLKRRRSRPWLQKRTSQYSRDEEGESSWSPHSLHILLLGVLCDWDALAVGFELVLNNLSICIVFDAERVVQHPSDVIFSKHRQQKKI